MNEQSNDRLTASADYIYSGDVKKWIRFANSLKLRLAMRIVNADPTTARKMVEEALILNTEVLLNRTLIMPHGGILPAQ